MEYTINLSINGQCLTADKIISVNGTVDIIRCNFTFESWDDFPARVAIFQSKAQRKAWVASLMNGSCLIPWEALVREGEVLVALVGTNTDGQVQRTETKTVVLQKKTLQGGVNSITPTPDQYAQFIAEVEAMIGEAGVLSVNGMTGDVTLTASDVGALSDATVIPDKTSDLINDSGFLSSIPSEYVTETELATAISGKANTADLSAVATSGDYDDLIDKPNLSAVATSGSYNDLTDKPTIPTKTSQLQNDSGFLTSAPVSSVNNKTGAVSLTASDVGALPDSTVIPTKTSDLVNDSNFVSDASYVHTDNNFTTAEKNKLTGIEAGAEVNVIDSISVNGTTITPVNKEVDITVSAGLSNDIKNALLDCFENVAWIGDNGATYYNALLALFYPVASITAVFNQGTAVIYDTDTLDTLRQYLTVTAIYEDGTSGVVTNYTLSGTLTTGTSTITASFGGKTATFNVTVSSSSQWDFEWYSSSGTLPSGMTATSYNFSSEAGVLYVADPVLDFNYIGDAEIEVECKWGNNLPNANNPAIILKRGAKAGTKVYSTGNTGGVATDLATNISGTNVTTNIYTNEYHVINIKGEGSSYTLTIDGTDVFTGSGVTNNNYLQNTGIYCPQNYNYTMYIKSIKFREIV